MKKLILLTTLILALPLYAQEPDEFAVSLKQLQSCVAEIQDLAEARVTGDIAALLTCTPEVIAYNGDGTHEPTVTDLNTALMKFAAAINKKIQQVIEYTKAEDAQLRRSIAGTDSNVNALRGRVDTLSSRASNQPSRTIIEYRDPPPKAPNYQEIQERERRQKWMDTKDIGD